MTAIVFDLEKIPEYQRNELSDLAISLTKAVFERPGEEERYQQWLKERRSRIANSRKGGSNEQ